MLSELKHILEIINVQASLYLLQAETSRLTSITNLIHFISVYLGTYFHLLLEVRSYLFQ